MDVLFDGASVRVLASEDVIYLQSPSCPGLACTYEDLRQFYELFKFHASGTITLRDGAVTEFILGHQALEIRQHGQIIVQVLPKVKVGTNINDLTGFYDFLSQLDGQGEDDFELRPTYGYFLDLNEPRNGVVHTVSVLNLQVRSLGKLQHQDIVPFRQGIEQDAVSIYLSNLFLQKSDNGVMLSPDNRERDLPPGHRQIFNFEAPLELSVEAARHLVDTAEFLMEFETRAGIIDE